MKHIDQVEQDRYVVELTSDDSSVKVRDFEDCLVGREPSHAPTIVDR